MLRTTLRSSRSIPSLRVAANPVSQRSLASTALFQTAWEKSTVPVLKAALKARGLSTAGRKDVLVSRIKSAEASFPSTRSLSSSPSAPAAAAAAPKKVVSAEDSAKKGETSLEELTAPGTVEVSSNATAGVPSKEESTTSTQAPGLPNNPFDSAATTLNVKMPQKQEAEDESAPVPTILGAGGVYPPSPAAEPSPEPTVKLLTTASASTHNFPPRSHLNALSDSHSIDVAEGEKEANDFSRPLTDQESTGLTTAALIIASLFGFSYVVDWISPRAVNAVHKAEKLAKEEAAKLEKEAKKLGSKAEGKLEEVKGKAKGVVDEGKKKVEEGKEKLQEGREKVETKAGEAKDKVEKKVGEGKEKAEEVVDEGKKKAGEAKEKVEKTAGEVKEAVKEKTK